MTDATTLAADLLRDHRAAIDRLDAILVYTLAERFKQTQAVGGGGPRPGSGQEIPDLHHQ
jgi:hypothetical protein